MQKQFDICREITVNARKTENSTILKKLGVPMPPGFQSIRWNAWFHQGVWVFTHYHILKSHSTIAISPDFKLDIARFGLAMLKPLVDIVLQAQVAGPGDTYVLISALLISLATYLKNDEFEFPFVKTQGAESLSEADRALCKVGVVGWKELSLEHNDDMRNNLARVVVELMAEYLAGRLFRRFFFGEFVKQSEIIIGVSSTRKENLLRNACVLATFDLLPGADGFSFLVTSGIATQNEVRLLSERAHHACLDFHQRIDPDFSEAPAPKESESKRSKFSILSASSSHAAAEYNPEAAHINDVQAFRSNATVLSLFDTFNTESECDTWQTKRVALCQGWMKGATFPWIKKVLQIVLSKPLTSVLCESNFKILQTTLSSSRLSMKPEMLRAYLLARTVPQFFGLKEKEKAPMGDGYGKTNIANFFKQMPRFTPTVAPPSPTTSSTPPPPTTSSSPLLQEEAPTVSNKDVDDEVIVVETVNRDALTFGIAGVDAERSSSSTSIGKGAPAPDRRSGRKTQVNAIVEVFLWKERASAPAAHQDDVGEEVEHEDGEFEIGD